MGTTADKLNRLVSTKESIRQEINRAYGTEEIGASDTFSSYIQKLEDHPFYLMTYIEKSIKSIKVSSATSIGDYAFFRCSNLTSVSSLNATSIGYRAFYECSSLTSVSLPSLTVIPDGESSFGGLIVTGVFSTCNKLTSASFLTIKRIGTYAFKNCTSLTTIYIGTNASTVCTLSDTNAFEGCTNLANIYVPASLVDSYKSATNWSNYADKIKAAP